MAAHKRNRMVRGMEGERGMKSGVIIVICFFALVGFLAALWVYRPRFTGKGDKMRKLSAVLFGLLALSGCGFEQVDEGYRGIETNFGKVVGEPLAPGLHFYNPVTSDIFEMDVRERKLEGNTSCFTHDTQNVVVQYAITFYPDPAKIGALYTQFGNDWDAKIVNQTVLGSIKDAIGKLKADDLVSQRESARNSAEDQLQAALGQRFVTVTKLELTNLDFDDKYEQAVEDKVVAVQRAAEAKNKTVQVEEEAKQTVAAAKADAEAMRIKTEALSRNQGLVDYEAIQKWDGKLPEIMMGGSVPLVNMDRIMRKAE